MLHFWVYSDELVIDLNCFCLCSLCNYAVVFFVFAKYELRNFVLDYYFGNDMSFDFVIVHLVTLRLCFKLSVQNDKLESTSVHKILTNREKFTVRAQNSSHLYSNYVSFVHMFLVSVHILSCVNRMWTLCTPDFFRVQNVNTLYTWISFVNRMWTLCALEF